MNDDSSDGGTSGQTDQQFSADQTRIMPRQKPVAQKMHPAAKSAAQHWQNLHGAKFHANATRKKSKS